MTDDPAEKVPMRMTAPGVTTDKVLAYVRLSTARGRALTIRDIREGARLSSTSVVKYHVDRLVADGLVLQEQALGRTIRAAESDTAPILDMRHVPFTPFAPMLEATL